MNPTGQPSFGSSPPLAGATAGDPREKVNVPSLIMMIGAGLGLVLHLISIAMSLLGLNKPAIPPELASDPNAKAFVDFANAMDKGGPLFGLVGIAICAFVLFGALKMRNLQSWGLALAACIVASLPCCNGCYCLTMVGGIWGLVVLNQPEVKSAFTG